MQLKEEHAGALPLPAGAPGPNGPALSEEEALLAFIRVHLLQSLDGPVDPDTLIFERFRIDSIRILDLIGYIERRLGRRLEDSEIVMQNFRSVRAIVKAFL